jgi:hypothetical protein
MINKYAMRSILEHLDAAHAALAETRQIEGHAAWNIRMARTRLYEASIADVAVEQVGAV